MPFRDSFPVLMVTDMARSQAFYRDLLGFDQLYAFPAEGEPVFVSLTIPGGKLGLGAADGRVEAASTALWLYCDDVDAEVDRLRTADVPVIAEPADQVWGERTASVSDPDGYTVHIGAASG